VDVHEQVAQLRQVIATARSMPMSASALVNRAEVLAMLDQLADDLPGAFGEAAEILTHRDQVIEEGHQQAAEILAAARAQHEGLVSDSEVYQMAKQRAEQILQEARTESDGLRRETDEYVDSKLANFEIALHRTLEAVTRGRERLQGRSELDTLGVDNGEYFPPPGDHR
jgi:cell division septum initiation protein DivIVA